MINFNSVGLMVVFVLCSMFLRYAHGMTTLVLAHLNESQVLQFPKFKPTCYLSTVENKDSSDYYFLVLLQPEQTWEGKTKKEGTRFKWKLSHHWPTFTEIPGVEQSIETVIERITDRNISDNSIIFTFNDTSAGKQLKIISFFV